MDDGPTTASRVSTRAHTAVPPEGVVELFGVHPPSWIRPLLTLSSPPTAAGGRGAPSFDLSPPEHDGTGAASVGLTWCPDQGAGTFSRFEGRFLIQAVGSGSAIILDGVVEGGSPPTNQAVLDTVVRRLVRTVEAAYSRG